MTLYELVSTIKQASLDNPLIKTWVGDMKSLMTSHNLQYGVVAIDLGLSSIEKGYLTSSFSLYYVNRMSDSPDDSTKVQEDDDALRIQSDGMSVLQNVIDSLHNVGTLQVSYQPFKKQFIDYTAGVLAQVTVRVPFTYCYDIFNG